MTNKNNPPEETKQTEISDRSEIKTISSGENNRWNWLFRYASDFFAIIFFSAAILSILGIVGISNGYLLNLWAVFLSRWLGWGSYSIPVLFIYIGFYFLNQKRQTSFVTLWKVLQLEIWIFLLLAFLSILGGHEISRAEIGLDGGLIGWGLAEIFQYVIPSAILYVLLILLLIGIGLYLLGILQILSEYITEWARQTQQESFLKIEDESPDLIENIQSENTQLKKPRKKKKRETQPVSQDEFTRPEDFPPLELLRKEQVSKVNEENVHQTASQIEKTLEEFGIPARVVGFRVGPTVTQFAVEPGFIEKTDPDGEVSRHKIRVSQISSLSRDLALALSANRLRIEAPVPGQSFVGIEVPNQKSMMVGLRSILESSQFAQKRTPLTIGLGKDVSGTPIVGDLARMPHLLIAGTTGSGKSVCISAITICLVMNNHPEDLQIAILDPKMVEMVRFNGLPHLLGKVETQPERMLAVLRWALVEMDRRYRLLESSRSRDIQSYNNKMKRQGNETLPWIVILIDELADLMMSAPDQTEQSIVRLAQMARATGIHMIVATQRPSTDVVTGLIKANFPARLSFSVASSVDSRVVLDETGAESLLGRGDMLFLNPEKGSPVRAQGVFVTDDEIEKVISFWQEQTEPETEEAPWEDQIQDDELDRADHLIEKAVELVRSTGRASASYLQRRLRIGYPRAARLIDELEELGVVGPSQGGGREREVLVGPDESDDQNEDEVSESQAEYTDQDLDDEIDIEDEE